MLVSVYRTRKEAEDKLPGIGTSLLSATYVEPERATVAGFLREEWLPAIKSTVRPSTHKLYETIVTAYVIPRLGAVRLQKLTAAHLNRLYGELLDSGKRDGTPLGAEMVARVHRLMHRALRDAVKWDRVPRNAATSADPPRAPRPEIRAWSAQELHAFLDHAADDRLSALWYLLATAGLRRAEALGVRWVDLDLEAGRLSIRQTLATWGPSQ